jgi:hypothetical protein
MSEPTNYTFKIKNFTPETMPFGRLAEYYRDLSIMLGQTAAIHLVGVAEGSHASALKIDVSGQTEVRRRIKELEIGTAPAAALKARASIVDMLNEDETSASFEDENGNNVIAFPSKVETLFRPLRIRDTATFVGELYHIAGTKDDAKVRLTTDDYGTVFCTTTRAIAKTLRDFLFEDVRVSGRGVWVQTEDVGNWDIESFVITDFSPVRNETVRAAVDRVRNLKVVWPEDPIGMLDSMNEKNGGAT